MTVDPFAIALVSALSLLVPGPAVLLVIGTALGSGRKAALVTVLGVMTASTLWSAAAAFGMGALMLANAWAFEVVRYAGGAYLLFLAWRSARSAWRGQAAPTVPHRGGALQPMPARTAFLRGLAVHLANPKAVLFFGSLYALAVPPGASIGSLALVMLAIAVPGLAIYALYAVVFSVPQVAAGYVRMRRWAEAVFALAFGALAVRVLTSRVPT